MTGIRTRRTATVSFLFSLFLLLSPQQVRASASCYSTEEAGAEQLLRLHSELMVITVTCRHSSRGVGLSPTYTNFTRRNKEAIQRAEKTMQKHFESVKKGTGLNELDRLRTRLANEISAEAARDSAPYFCAERRDKVASLNDLSPSVIEEKALVDYAAVKTYKPLCSSGLKKVVAKR